MKANDLIHQIEKCKQLIEKKLNWGSSEFWTHSFYEKLSETIENEVHEQISFSTLKRIWGKLKPDFGVSIYSLNILARFVGYHNWNSFISEQKIEEIATIESQNNHNIIVNPLQSLDIQPNFARTKNLNWSKFSIIFLLIAAILSIFIFFFVYENKEKEYFLFYINRGGKMAPSKCEIFYNIKFLENNEKCHVFFGDGNLKLLNPDSHNISSVFTKPNKYLIKLYREDVLLKIESYIVYTNGWQKTIIFPDKDFVVDTLLLENLSQITPSLVQRYDKINVPYWLEYYNINSIFQAVDCDNFEFEIRFKIFEQIARFESQFALKIQGDSSSIRLHLSNSANLGMFNKISEKVIEKNSNEQNGFVKDLSEFHTLKIRNIKQNVTIYFDNKEFYKAKYKKKIDHLFSLKFLLFNCGEIDWYKISDLKGNTLLSEKFVR